MEREAVRKRGGQLTPQGAQRRKLAQVLGVSAEALRQREKRGRLSPRQQRLDRLVLEHGELVGALEREHSVSFEWVFVNGRRERVCLDQPGCGVCVLLARVKGGEG